MLISERIQVCTQCNLRKNDNCTHKGIDLIFAARKTETCTSWKPNTLLSNSIFRTNNSPQVNTQISSVSVIITCHNYDCYLAEAIESVLNQTHLPDEILVVDDSSSDNTQQVAQQFSKQGVQYIRVENQRAHLSRYDGLLATQSEIVLFLDADNTLPPDYLETGLQEFTSSDVGVVYADLHKFGDREEKTNFPEYSQAKLFRENFVDAGSLIRREALLNCDAWKDHFDERLLSEDYWMFQRLSLDGWDFKKQTSALNYRVHDRQKSQRSRGLRIDKGYFYASGLNRQEITLCIPLTGRSWAWEQMQPFLERQTWPKDQLQLILIDTSQSESFRKLIRKWIKDSDYPHIRHIKFNAGDSDTASYPYKDTSNRAAELAKCRLLNQLRDIVITPYCWILEDSILPPDDVLERLLKQFSKDVGCVSAPYASPQDGKPLVWGDDEFRGKKNYTQGPAANENQVTDIRGSGFGCIALRTELLKEHVFSVPRTENGVAPFFFKTMGDQWKRLCDWSCWSEQLVNPKRFYLSRSSEDANYDVDVFIPYYRNLHLVPQTIDSVLWQLNVKSLIHLVNDCSCEDDTDLKQRYGQLPNIHWYKTKKKSDPYAIANSLFYHTETDMISIVAPDDEFPPSHFMTVFKEMKEHNVEVWISSMTEYLNPSENLDRRSETSTGCTTIYSDDGAKCISSPSPVNGPMVIKRKAFEAMNGFNNLIAESDTHLIRRANAAGFKTLISEKVVSPQKQSYTSQLHNSLCEVPRDKQNRVRDVQADHLGQIEVGTDLHLIGRLDQCYKSDLVILSNGKGHQTKSKTKMAVLVAIFDPTGNGHVLRNYNRFRAELSADVDVFVAEASYTGRFHVQDATVKINATQRQVLWQKERLYNLLLDQLPQEYKYVMWADADIIFENENWLKETFFLLKTHDVVFPYSTATRLGADGKPERKQRAVPLVDQIGIKPDAPEWHKDRAQGLAWAFSREWLDRHRFDDYCMNGAGDSHDYYAIKGDTNWGKEHYSKGSYPLWVKRYKAIRDTRITYASGHVVHLYHGSKNNRQYKPLEELLKKINFKPQRDIRISENGLWEWIGEEPAYDVIRESFYKRQAETIREKRYSSFLKDGSTKPTWNSPLGEAIMSKHAGKSFVRSLNFPNLRIPQTYQLRSDCVIKPDRDCGGRRFRVIQNSEDWICEEYIPHDKDYGLYVFSGKVVMVHIVTCKETASGMSKTGFVFKRHPGWQTLNIHQKLIDCPEMIIKAEYPKCLPQMVRISEEISYHFPVPVRVDFFIDEHHNPVFNEMSITPGLAKDGGVTDEGDLWLGSFLSQPQLNLRQAHEPEGGPVPLSRDTGILTSSDDAFFPAFQLLFVSVMTRYKTKFAVVDLGLTARQRAWCEHQPDITLLDLPETLPVSRSAEVWQNWNKPLYFQMSPFKRNLWIDSDCVVMGGLEVMAATLQDRFYTCECVADFRREDRMTYPHYLFGTKPVNDTLVMAGICGFDRERDADFIAHWLAKCIELEKAPREKRVMRDQEALQWMVDANGHHDSIIRGSKWNECNVKYNSAGPREFLNSLPKQQANIYHFYGSSKGKPPFWSTWGEIPIW